MNLNDMTVTELRKLASECSISGRSTMKKAELIEAITAHREAEEGVTQDAELEYHEDEDGFAYYLPKTETSSSSSSDHNPDTQGLPGAFDFTETEPQRVFTTKTATEVQDVVSVEMERTRPGGGMMYVFRNDVGVLTAVKFLKRGCRWEIVDHKNGILFVVKGGSLQKVAKRWAKKLGYWANRIDVTTAY